MPTNVWRGDAQAIRDVWQALPANLSSNGGERLRLTCNRKYVEFTMPASSVQSDPVPVAVQGLAQLLGASAPFAEFQEMTPSIHLDPVSGEADYLEILGPTDGTPITLDGETLGADGSGTVTVTTIQAGTPATDEIQRVVLPGPPTGGTFTLTFAGQTTSALARNASAATVQSALQGLSSIGSGNATVALNATSDWSVTFTGALAGQDVPLLVGDGTSLTGAGQVSVTTTTQGGPGVDEVQTITCTASSNLQSTGGNPTNYFWKVNFNNNNASTSDPYDTAWLHHDATASEVRIALEAVPNIGSGNVTVTRAVVSGDPVFTIKFVGALANHNVIQLVPVIYILNPATNALLTNDAVTTATVTDGSASATNEVQVVTLINGPLGGTFTLTFQGQTTSGIAFNASAATVQSALIALSNIGSSDVVVSGSNGGPWTVTFQTALGGLDVQQMTGSGSSLTGGNVNVATTQDSAAGINEQERIVLNGTPTGGTFTLTFNSQTTSAIAFDATAATVQAALEGLATPVPGDIIVTGGPGPASPWIVEFTGQYAATDVTQMTGDGTSLTVTTTATLTLTETTTPTGPNWVDDDNNWSLGHAPANSEDLVISGTRDILYGLETLSAVTPRSLIIDSNFTAKLGLEYDNGNYIEYRPRYWKIGGAGTMPVTIGAGDGGGSSRIFLNLQTNHATVLVLKTGQSDGTRPCLLLLLNNSSAELDLQRGSVGIAFEPGQSSVMSLVRESFVDTPDSDSFVVLGLGVTIDSIIKIAGYMRLFCPITTALTQYAGVMDVEGANDLANSGSSAGLALFGGQVNWKSTGVIYGMPVICGDGLLNFDGDSRSKVVWHPIDVFGDVADVKDSNKVATTNGESPAALVIDYNKTTRNPALGIDYRIKRMATA